MPGGLPEVVSTDLPGLPPRMLKVTSGGNGMIWSDAVVGLDRYLGHSTGTGRERCNDQLDPAHVRSHTHIGWL